MPPESQPAPCGRFKSRAKHSAYKECTECQKRRLAVAAAIKRRAPANEIQALKDEYASHLQWMMKQRRRLEQITHMANHEGMIVECSDKCGDDCLYVPADGVSAVSAARTRDRRRRHRMHTVRHTPHVYHTRLSPPPASHTLLPLAPSHDAPARGLPPPACRSYPTDAAHPSCVQAAHRAATRASTSTGCRCKLTSTQASSSTSRSSFPA